jgi:hypothetical protein
MANPPFAFNFSYRKRTETGNPFEARLTRKDARPNVSAEMKIHR